MNYSEDKIELDPGGIIYDAFQAMSPLVEKSIKRAVILRSTGNDDLPYALNFSSLFRVTEHTKEDAVNAGHQLIEEYGIQDAIVSPYEHNTLLGFGRQKGLEQFYYWGYKIQMPREEFYGLAQKLGIWKEVKQIIDQSKQKITEVNKSLLRSSELLGIPIKRIDINKKDKRASVSFGSFDMKTPENEVGYKVYNYLREQIFETFAKKMALVYGFEEGGIEVFDNSAYMTDEVRGFYLKGEKNVKRLIQFVNPAEPQPEIKEPMSYDGWEGLLSRKRQEILDNREKIQDNLEREESSRFLDSILSGFQKTPVKQEVPESTQPQEPSQTIDKVSEKKAGHNVSPPKASSKLSEEYQQIFNKMMEEIQRGEYGS